MKKNRLLKRILPMMLAVILLEEIWYNLIYKTSSAIKIECVETWYNNYWILQSTSYY